MAWQRSASLEHHAPGHGRYATTQFLIDEIADTAGTESERRDRCNKIGNGKKRAPRFAREIKHGEDHADEPAVERHPAGPEIRDFERVVEIVRQIVKQHVPQPSAENHAENDVKQQVGYFLRLPTKTGPLGLSHRQPPATDEADEVHEAVPVDLERSETDGDGVDVGRNKHGFLRDSAVRPRFRSARPFRHPLNHTPEYCPGSVSVRRQSPPSARCERPALSRPQETSGTTRILPCLRVPRAPSAHSAGRDAATTDNGQSISIPDIPAGPEAHRALATSSGFARF